IAFLIVSGSTMSTVPQITVSANRQAGPRLELITKNTAAAQNNVNNITLARSQQEIPIRPPAITKVKMRGFRRALASRNSASKIGSTEIASGKRSTEFQASCGEKAAKKPATTPVLRGNNSATTRKISTAEKASSAICTN